MILVARFQHSWRERLPEWATSFGLMIWGVIIITSKDLFERPFFHPFANIAPQWAWGWGAFFVGALRIVCLIRNGGWRPSAHLRAIGAFVGTIIWGQVFVCALSVDWLSPAMALALMPLFLDAWSLHFASGDAKVADLAARERAAVNVSA